MQLLIVILLIGGALLIYSSIKDRDPRDVIRQALQLGDPTGDN